MDSVYVTAGNKRGYTDSKGMLSLTVCAAGTIVTTTKAGYLAQSKK
jgi:hypothetical protein